MKTLILYYTFGGACEKEAKRLAEENANAVLCRVYEKKNRSLLGSFIPGCLQAMKRKKTAIIPPDAELAEYDSIVIGCPIWAGYPAPAWNSMIDLLPAGRDVELFFCSAGGEEPKSEESSRAAVAAKGCSLVSYRDVRTGASPSKMKA